MTRLLKCGIALGALILAPELAPAQEATWCSPQAPTRAQSFTLADLDSLVGKFELVFVKTIPSEHADTTQGQLELWRQDSSRVWPSRHFGLPVPDSLRRARPERARYLAGAFDVSPRDFTSWWRRVASRDPAYPGVEWYSGLLRFGDRDVPDGTGDDLKVDWVASGQFGGSWHRDLGIAVVVDAAGNEYPNPSGYFCARRIG